MLLSGATVASGHLRLRLPRARRPRARPRGLRSRRRALGGAVPARGRALPAARADDVAGRSPTGWRAGTRFAPSCGRCSGSTGARGRRSRRRRSRLGPDRRPALPRRLLLHRCARRSASPRYGVAYVMRGVFAGAGWFNGYALLLVSDGAVRVAVVVPLLFVASRDLAAAAMVAAAVGSVALPVLVGRRVLRPLVDRGEGSPFHVGAAVAFAWPAAVIAIADQVLVNGGPLLVMLGGGENVGKIAGPRLRGHDARPDPGLRLPGPRDLDAAEPDPAARDRRARALPPRCPSRRGRPGRRRRGDRGRPRRPSGPRRCRRSTAPSTRPAGSSSRCSASASAVTSRRQRSRRRCSRSTAAASRRSAGSSRPPSSSAPMPSFQARRSSASRPRSPLGTAVAVPLLGYALIHRRRDA